MKFSEQWLKEWVDIESSVDELSHQLSMAGLEVASVEPVAQPFNQVVVAEVMTVEQHPNADRLHVCSVDVGHEEPLTIVCGAKNVRPHMKVPAALIGARFSSEFKITKSKLRGVESFGMLCSAKELGLAETSEGLLELPSDAPVGQDVRDYLLLNDHVIDADLTPNRGDCASILGLAREVAAIYRTQYHQPKIKSITPVSKETCKVVLNAPEAAPKYVGRVIREIDIHATTPLWIQEKLRRSGVRSIDPVVDVTNYVMLELGQPMHAFDFDQLEGDIEVRFARSDEKLTLLNDETVNLDEKVLVIADQKKALAMAGVMGGLASSVTDKTRHIFLESAFFNPMAIVGVARRYGLQTDSSYRFERGIDATIQRLAIERATQLLVDIVGGIPGPVVEAVNQQDLPQEVVITFKPQRAIDVIGTDISLEEMQEILLHLGLDIHKGKAGAWKVTVPPHRYDLLIEEDLIEEIARLYGYEKIPSHTYKIAMDIEQRVISESRIKSLRQLLQVRDYHEVISYTFVDPQDVALFDPNNDPFKLTNPIAENMSVMRTTLWPGLINILRFNLNHQQNRIRLFEIGARFLKANGALKEDAVISGLITGFVNKEQWGVAPKPADFFDLKSDVEALLSHFCAPDVFTFKAVHHPALHPGQSAEILMGQNISVGILGALHPALIEKYDIRNNVLLFEIKTELLNIEHQKRFQPISKFPAVRRDLSILVDQSVTAQDLIEDAHKTLGPLLVDSVIFDVYEGNKVESGKKSVAIGLTLQDFSRTLQDSDVNDLIVKTVQSLTDHFKAMLRD